MNSRDIVRRIIAREGGSKYTDIPEDRGGPTKWGITQAAWSDYKGFKAEPDDIKAITEPEAIEFYLLNYVEEPWFVYIEPPLLKELVVDCGVNHGPRRASRWLQEAVGAQTDGIVGPKTLQSLSESDPTAVFLRICAIRTRFYGSLISIDRSQAIFAKGWNRRAAEFLDLLAERIEPTVCG